MSSDSFYVNGVIPSIGKRIAQFAFNNKFHKFEKDTQNHSFVVYIKEGVNPKIIEHFKNHWPGFKVVIVSTQEA